MGDWRAVSDAFKSLKPASSSGGRDFQVGRVARNAYVARSPSEQPVLFFELRSPLPDWRSPPGA
jgi:hypothetical protein